MTEQQILDLVAKLKARLTGSTPEQLAGAEAMLRLCIEQVVEQAKTALAPVFSADIKAEVEKLKATLAESPDYVKTSDFDNRVKALLTASGSVPGQPGDKPSMSDFMLMDATRGELKRYPEFGRQQVERGQFKGKSMSDRLTMLDNEFKKYAWDITSSTDGGSAIPRIYHPEIIANEIAEAPVLGAFRRVPLTGGYNHDWATLTTSITTFWRTAGGKNYTTKPTHASQTTGSKSMAPKIRGVRWEFPNDLLRYAPALIKLVLDMSLQELGRVKEQDCLEGTTVGSASPWNGITNTTGTVYYSVPGALSYGEYIELGHLILPRYRAGAIVILNDECAKAWEKIVGLDHRPMFENTVSFGNNVGGARLGNLGAIVTENLTTANGRATMLYGNPGLRAWLGTDLDWFTVVDPYSVLTDNMTAYQIEGTADFMVPVPAAWGEFDMPV